MVAKVTCLCYAMLLLLLKVYAEHLESPCPSLFVYENRTEPDKWFGIVTLISDSQLSEILVRINLDKPALQLGNWLGEVTTSDRRSYLVKNKNHTLYVNKPYRLRFFVKYDRSKPVPRLASIRLNDKTICPEGRGTSKPPTTSTQLAASSIFSTTPRHIGATPAPTERPSTTPQIGQSPSSQSAGFQTTSAFGITPTNVGPGSDTEDDIFSGHGSDSEDDIFPNDFKFRPDFLDVNSTTCGTIAVQAKPLILYGKKTLIGQFPWHAAIYHSRGVGLNYVCGGSLVSRYHVLTAGHCVTGYKTQHILKPDNLLVYLGKYYLKQWNTPGVQNRHVIKIIRHKKYSGRLYRNDIAVLKLASAADFTNYVRPVCLWEGKNDINSYVGRLGTVVGWGYNEHGKLTEELTKLNMPIIAKEPCIYSYPEFFVKYTTSKTFCAGFKNDSTVCNGDSGGGLILPKKIGNPKRKAYHLRGIVSLSVALQNEFKCDPKYYVVFTDVAKYIKFIKSAMAE